MVPGYFKFEINTLKFTKSFVLQPIVVEISIENQAIQKSDPPTSLEIFSKLKEKCQIPEKCEKCADNSQGEEVCLKCKVPS